jgi:hypothetical protein
MNMSLKRLLDLPTKVILLLVMAGGILGWQPVAAIAQNQPSSSDPLQDFKKTDGYDPFSSTGGNGVTPGFFEFVHQAIQGAPSQTEFQSGQGENLDSAAANFRAKQQELLKQQPATTPTPAPALPQ